jgi:hypothetical protein
MGKSKKKKDAGRKLEDLKECVRHGQHVPTTPTHTSTDILPSGLPFMVSFCSRVILLGCIRFSKATPWHTFQATLGLSHSSTSALCVGLPRSNYSVFSGQRSCDSHVYGLVADNYRCIPIFTRGVHTDCSHQPWECCTRKRKLCRLTILHQNHGALIKLRRWRRCCVNRQQVLHLRCAFLFATFLSFSVIAKNADVYLLPQVCARVQHQSFNSAARGGSI